MEDASKDLGAGFAVENPVGYLKKARQNRDYFLFFALAVSYFEFYGYQILRRCYWDKVPDKFKKRKILGAHAIIREMKNQKMISETAYKNMKDINVKRNDIVHSKTDIHLKYKMDDEGRILMDNAIAYVDKLKVKYDSI